MGEKKLDKLHRKQKQIEFNSFGEFTFYRMNR